MEKQLHLTRKDTVNLGSFYTPRNIAGKVYELIENNIDIDNLKNYVLLDSSCGYGNLLDTNIIFRKRIGADIDEYALNIAKRRFSEEKNVKLFQNNSLINADRNKFGISQRDKLFIVANPPYNDKTSIIKNYLKKSEIYESDKDLAHRDLGISFLLSFNKLDAEYICVLHPLSYLIKETNFKSLKLFKERYRLIDGIIISSHEFTPRSLGFFPIIIALYKRDDRGMDYDFITKHIFKTVDNKRFSVNDFDYIGNYIDKYPNKKRITKDKCVAMFYTMRDINALRRSKTFIYKDCANAVYVTQDKYSLYCYVDIFKKMIFNIPYYLGNLDIPINYERFKENEADFVICSETNVLSDKVKKYFKNLLGVHYANI